MKRTTGLVAALIVGALVALSAGLFAQSKADAALRAAIETETVKGDLKAAIEQYKALAAGTDRAVAAKALVRLGECYQKQGSVESMKAWQRVVREFADQTDAVAQARERLAAMGSSGARPAAGPRAEHLWTVPAGRDVWGRPSPDGRYLSFDYGSAPSSQAATDHPGLWLHDVVSGEDRQIVADPRAYAQLAFSPDGKQVAYTRRRGNSGPTQTSDLSVVGIDGSGARVVRENPTRPPVVASAWSPDGAQILSVAMGFPPKVSPGLVSASDGTFRPLGSEDIEGNFSWSPDTFQYSFSPDGKYLAYSHFTKKAFVMPVSGGPAVTVVDGEAASWMPSWTPDGRAILFLSDRSGATDLWSRRVVGGRPEGEAERIMAIPTAWRPLGFARDGSLFYTVRNEQADVYVTDLDPATGKVASPPTRFNQRSVGTTQGPPRWSPDGSALLYRRVAPGKLVNHSMATGDERDVTLQDSPACPLGCTPFDWYPDGQSWMAIGRAGGQASSPLSIVKVDGRTGATQPLWTLAVLSNFAGGGLATLSPDGKTLYYTQNDVAPNPPRNPTLVVRRRDLPGGDDKELYRRAVADLTSPRVSPDGQTLAFIAAIPDDPAQPRAGVTRVLTLVPTGGGEPREVVRTKTEIRMAAWTRDGRHLLVVHSDSKAGQDQLWSYPVDGGEPVPAGLNMQIIGGVDVHPDGRRLAFVGRTSRLEVWALRNVVKR